MAICFGAGVLVGIIFTIVVAVALGGEGMDDDYME